MAWTILTKMKKSQKSPCLSFRNLMFDFIFATISTTSLMLQLVELERLRRELAYRKQLNDQQNNMISQQRAQLSMGQDEMIKIDNR